MKVIYIDTLFLLNLAIDYALTVMCAQVCGVRLRRVRYALAAAVGAMYAAAVYLPGLGWLGRAPVKLAAGVIMALVAFGGEQRPFRCAAVFFAVAAAFGGFIWALTLAGGYPAFDMRTLVAAFALCYVLLRAVFSGRVRLAERARVNVELTLGARTTQFIALVDTGNDLTDPISAMPVMVLCPHAAAPLLGANAALLELDAVAFVETAADIPELCGRLRLIPYSAVGGGGVLAAFRPDKAVVDGEERVLLAAVSPHVSGDGYEGVI